ncbi:DUF4229 domain-containing protein [Pseudoclavibacter terrae]|uniref:DUF4229 domain-containing protein n=1 Tax=Pseudoclavibacter terrae TaxID=1530195 RepID=UPI00232B5907|nr:DUF4229 domain-containing protein [Pseudoclavibacter terrae]
MNSKRAWLVYSVIRLLAFAVPFAVVMLALPAWQWNWLAGALVGAVISACISVIFLRGTRQQMGDDLQRLTERKDARTADDKDEDAALDSTAETAAAEPGTETDETAETEPAKVDSGEEQTPDSSPQHSPNS